MHRPESRHFEDTIIILADTPTLSNIHVPSFHSKLSHKLRTKPSKQYLFAAANSNILIYEIESKRLVAEISEKTTSIGNAEVQWLTPCVVCISWEKHFFGISTHDHVVSLMLDNLLIYSKEYSLMTYDGESIRNVVKELIDYTALTAVNTRTIAVGMDNGEINFRDVKTFGITATLENHSRKVTSLSMLDEHHLVSCSWDDTILVHNIIDKTVQHKIRFIDDFDLMKTTVIPKGHIIIRLLDGDDLRIYDYVNGTYVVSVYIGVPSSPQVLYVQSDLIICNTDDEVVFYDIKTGSYEKRKGPDTIACLHCTTLPLHCFD
jgi:hypothetical protein